MKCRERGECASVYNIIKALCEEKQISVAQMCKDLGLRQGLISDLKHGRSKTLSAVKMQKIANYFHVSVDVLCNVSSAN